VGQFRRVRWWTSASVVVPTVFLCMIVATGSVLTWPVSLLYRRRVEVDALTRRLNAATRLALLFDVVAISAAVWLVVWGRPLVALSSPIVGPIGLGIYAAAWAGVLLTPLTIWHATRFSRARIDGLSAWGREGILVAVHMILVAFCLYWRIAGTTLAL
jgi:hypothetical protein